MIIDSHSHLFDKPFDSDREEVVARMKMANIATIVVGTSYKESVAAVSLAERLGMWATVGQHPTDTFEEFDIEKYKRLAKNPVVVGIGECGLDYFQSRHSSLSLDNEKLRQRKLFEQHVELALEVNKPLMLHVRDSWEDTFSVFNSYSMINDSRLRAHFHFFSGDWEAAKKCLDKGWTLSFPGTITFTRQYDEVVKNVPEDSFTIETDAPYVAPMPYRGKRNEPSYIIEVAKKVAELRGISFERVLELTTANAVRVFDLQFASEA
ncbi:MAG: hypothetical protein A2749_02980 [Parcubacteria group bacterium RIFCSPHIGHO2_01_FULL_45_26]|nr:MAG: hypothetical protein A2749_02980 [Parcubacteria group bacterium RIFCSPHIGHO2_01_FULL_45_26]